MESQLHRPQDTGLHVGEGHGQVHDEGEQHHQKKSVLKKVKAKARKIKDTIKHGLSHEHELEHQQLQGEHGVDEEEEEGTDNEEMEEDAEVHGGPYAIRSKDIPKEDILSNLENPTSQKEDRYDTNMKNEDVHKPSLQRQDEFARPPSVPETDETKDIDHDGAHGKQEHQGQQGHGGPTGLEPYPPHYRGEMHNPRSAIEKHRAEDIDHEITGLGPIPKHINPSPVEFYSNKGIDQVTGHGKSQNQGNIFGAPAGIEEDPHAPKGPMTNPNDSNYQSKVTDPTGHNNEEAGVSPLVRSFEKMGVDDAPEATPSQGAWQLGAGGGTGDTKIGQGTEHILSTGSHDQFAPEKAPPDFPSVHEDTESESLPKSMDLSNPEDAPQDTLTGKPASYTEKISSATSAIADKAVAAKNVVASKLGYGVTEEEANKPREIGDAQGTATATSSATEYAQKAAARVAEKLAPVYEKVAAAGSTVMAKVTGHENRGGVDTEHEVNTNPTDKGVSMKEYLAEKFKPGEEDKALSEVIQDSLSRQKEKTEETKPMGKVTVSEELERKLGPVEDLNKGDDNGGSGETQGVQQGVVDTIRGTVNSWLGRGGEAETSPPGTTNDSAVEGGAAVVGKAA